MSVNITLNIPSDIPPLLQVARLVAVRGSVMAREPSSSFRVVDPQVLLHEAPDIEVELQSVVQDEKTDVLTGVREVRDEYSFDIMGDT